MQKMRFWYNYVKYPFEPYSDYQDEDFDDDPKTYEECLEIQKEWQKEYQLLYPIDEFPENYIRPLRLNK